MKIEVKQNELINAINIASKAVSRNTNIQIHELIYFEADNDRLTLTAFDGEITIKTSIEAIVKEAGEIALKANLLSSIIRKLSGTIKIESKEGKINIKSENSNFNLIAFEYFEKQDLSLPDTKPLEIANDKLKRSILQTEFATSLDETKLALTGILFELKKGALNMVALDGYRVAHKENIIDYSTDYEDSEFIIPKRSLMEWSRIISEDTSTSIYKNENDIVFESDATTMFCRVIDKNFIDYKSILENNAAQSKIKLDKDSLIRALDRAQVLSDPGRANLIRIEIAEDHMIIKSNSEIGDVREVLKISLEGEGLDIAFNARYMQEGVRAFDSETIELSFQSSLNPCLIHPVDSKYEDENFTYLVLPVRLAN